MLTGSVALLPVMEWGIVSVQVLSVEACRAKKVEVALGAFLKTHAWMATTRNSGWRGLMTVLRKQVREMREAEEGETPPERPRPGPKMRHRLL